MSGRSEKQKPKKTEAPGEYMKKRPTERAFVIQFEPVAGVRSRLRGRVELVASGEAMRFRSVKQLMGFIVGTLRKPDER
jgi:hypothetical protein